MVLSIVSGTWSAIDRCQPVFQVLWKSWEDCVSRKNIWEGLSRKEQDRSRNELWQKGQIVRSAQWKVLKRFA